MPSNRGEIAEHARNPVTTVLSDACFQTVVLSRNGRVDKSRFEGNQNRKSSNLAESSAKYFTRSTSEARTPKVAKNCNRFCTSSS